MKHARSDYNRIQDPSGEIPEDEPVFLIRAKDVVGPMVVREWARLASKAGASKEMTDLALAHAACMEQWQAIRGSQVPTLEGEDDAKS